MPHPIEVKAIRFLKRKLANKKIEKSDKKTFDLLVDGKYVEVKGKGANFNEIDFIGLSEKQFAAIKKIPYDIYLICGLKTKKPEIYRFNSKDLLKIRNRKIISFEFDKNELKKVIKKF